MEGTLSQPRKTWSQIQGKKKTQDYINTSPEEVTEFQVLKKKNYIYTLKDGNQNKETS